MLTIFLLYALAGFVALGYQVVWFRFFTDWFGSTNLTFALVVCNFIGGLGAGSLLSRTLAQRLGRFLGSGDRLRTYGLIELLVAASAACTALFPLLPADVWGAFPYHLAGGFWEPDMGYRLAQVGIGAALIFVPCLFMGTTFPLLCSAFVAEPSGARLPAALYACNTLGACAGILACQFLLLPAVGHGTTFWIVMAVNVLVGLFFLVRGGGAAAMERSAQAGERGPATAGPSLGLRAAPPGVLLICAILSGLLSGALEGDMFRRLGLFIVSSPGALMPLISFWAVLGIFLASALVCLEPRIRLTHIKVAVVLAFVCYWTASEFAYPVMNAMERETADRNPVIAMISGASLFPESSAQLFLVTGAVVFLPYLLISTLLPYVCNRLQSERRHLGLAYGLNTLAFCAGLLGFTLVAPLVNIFYSLKLMLVLAACGTLLLLSLSERRALRAWQPLAAIAAFAAGCAVTSTGFDASYINPRFPPAREPVMALKSNGATTSFVIRDSGSLRLYFGNLSMSGTNLQSQAYMRLMAHFPLLAQAKPRTALLICFGVGNTAAAIATHETIRALDIVDLNPRVFETAPVFAETNGRVYEDPRVRLITDDGRSFLRLTRATYDLITSEPPPPMSAGTYRLYSREYYRDVIAHLTPTGMMTQWLPVYQMPGEAVDLAIRTFLDAFPHTLLYVGFDMELILVGSMTPIDFSRVWQRAGESTRVSADLRGVGVTSPLGLLARVMRTDDSLRREYGRGPVISDEHNDLDRLYLAPERFAVVGYDPREVLAAFRAQSAGLASALAPVVTHLGRLRNLVPGFPLLGVSPEPAVTLSDTDWWTVTRLQRTLSQALRTGDRAEAAAIAEKTLQVAPEQPYILSLLARLYAGQGRLQEAERLLREYSRIEPNDPAVEQTRAAYLMDLGRAAEAVAALRRALELEPDNVQYLNNLAWILATHPDSSVRQPAQAVDLAQRATRLSAHRDPVALDTLGAALASTGRLSEAATMADQAATLADRQAQPDFGAAIRRRAVLYRQGRAFIDSRP